MRCRIEFHSVRIPGKKVVKALSESEELVSVGLVSGLVSEELGSTKLESEFQLVKKRQVRRVGEQGPWTCELLWRSFSIPFSR